MSRFTASVRAVSVALSVGSLGLSCASARSGPTGSPKPAAPAPATRGVQAGLPAAATAPEPVIPSRPLRTLLRTARSCHGDEREELVLRSPDEWQRWRDRAGCVAAPAEPVDFATELVLAVGDEPGPNACHQVEIVGAISGPDGLVVDVVRHVPGKNAICAMMLVHPAHAVAMPRFAGPIRFTWRDDTGSATR